MQGPLGGWIGRLEFQHEQAPAEMQMLLYYYHMLRDSRTLPIMHSSTMPSATLEVVGNELRFVPHHDFLLTLPAAMPFFAM